MMAATQKKEVEKTTPRQRYLDRLTMLQTERSTWLWHWYEIGEYIFPRRFRYLQTDRNKGFKRNDKIINNTPTRAVRTLGAGKMAGETSPARPWFGFEPENPENEQEMLWCEEVEEIMYASLARSNAYAKLHELWEGQAAFATAAMLIEEDALEDFRCRSLPIGQYCLASDNRGEIDTCYQEFSFTVMQLVKEFGIDKCCDQTQRLFRECKYDAWVEVVHVIEPNMDRVTGKIDAKNKPFRSIWLEKAAPSTHETFLRESGYEEFPVIVARWYVTGEDVYGSGSPGMDVLGDCKALQLAERRKATAVDLTVKPPMKGPTSMRTQKLSLLPGDMNYVDEDGNKGTFKPAIDPNPQAVPNSLAVVKEHEYRIEQSFFVDLFLTMQSMDSAPNGGKQPLTAREVAERHEEKMLMLGPVIERDETEVLAKMLFRILRILARKGKLPPPPPSMRGGKIKVKFTSIMAQAQKLLGTAAIERATSFIGSLSAVRPDILDLPNFDKIIRDYFEMLGVPPDAINSEEVVAKLRQARAQQKAQEQQMQQIQQGADAAKVASQADLNGDNVLSRLMYAQGGGAPIGGK